MSFAVTGFMEGPESLDDVDIPGFPSSAKPEGFTANLQVGRTALYDTYFVPCSCHCCCMHWLTEEEKGRVVGVCGRAWGWGELHRLSRNPKDSALSITCEWVPFIL